MISRVPYFTRQVAQQRRALSSLLVATEEFPMSFSASPKPAAAAVFSESTLSNGIKMSTKEFDAKVASFKISTEAGSAYESLSQKGAAHLLATSAFANTSTASSIRLIRDLENLGAVFESSADREKFTISLSCPSESAEAAFVKVSNFFVNGPNAHYLVDESKDIADIAYKNHFSDPASVLSELIHEASYGEGSPFGSSFYASDLSQLSGMDTLAFRSSNLKAGSTFIAASGVESKSLQTWAETAFQSLAAGVTQKPASKFVGGDVKLKAETHGAAYAAIAFPVPSGDAGKAYEVLEAVLRSKLVGTPVVPFLAKYSHGGIFGFYTTCSSSESSTHLQSGVAALKDIAKGAAGVDIAKNQVSLVKSMSLEGESATSVMLDAVRAGTNVANFIKYSDITASTVGAAAAASLKIDPAYAVLGSTLGTPSYEKIKSMMK